MSDSPTDVTSWRRVDPELMLTRLRKEVPRPKVGTWIIHKDISPLDLYVYLKARFGEPNGFAMTLKRPSSDNLIHWNWTLQSGDSLIDFLGYQLQALAAIDGTTDPSPEEVSAFIADIKADFSNHGPAMAVVRKSLENWIVFTNPYYRLNRVVVDMTNRLQALGIDQKALPPLPTTPGQFEEFQSKWSACQAAYVEALGYGLALRMLAPVLAESFVNLVIFLLAKPELKADDRLYRNALRQEIDIRVKTLHMTCQGFAKQIDGSESAFKAFHTLMNSRNDFLHGNVDPLQLKYETVYFDGTIPLFTQYKNISELSLVKSLAQVEPEVALRDVNVAKALITLVLDAMVPTVRTTVEAFMSTSDPGWREDKKMPGILFPQTIVHTVLGPSIESES